MNSADQLIYQASLMLDETGDAEAAMSALREAIALSELAQHHLSLLRARTLLGELFLELGRDEEAGSEFARVLAIASNFPDDPTLIDQEVATATGHLSRLTGRD